MAAFGIKAKKDKSEFLKDSLEFLGHVIDKEGLHTSPRKVEAIEQAPIPKNRKELQSFLGLVHYYGKFIPNLSTLLGPLNDLIKGDQYWLWCKRCDKAFKIVKGILLKAPVMMLYNPHLPIKQAASGIGAVISHILPDGSEHLIAYASCTLSQAECNYAQLEKEALSLIFGIKKLHVWPVTLVTDHKPLLCIWGPKQGIPELAAVRLQRWALILVAYTIIRLSFALQKNMEMWMDCRDCPSQK